MVDILNPALPYFGPNFIGFVCGKAISLPRDRVRHRDQSVD
jgi:hypothetical protein